MRKFDIDSKYSDNCISWHSLYMELASEFEESHPGEVIDEDTIRDKFRNSDGSGLVNKLKSVRTSSGVISSRPVSWLLVE